MCGAITDVKDKQKITEAFRVSKDEDFPLPPCRKRINYAMGNAGPNSVPDGGLSALILGRCDVLEIPLKPSDGEHMQIPLD